MAGYRRRDFLKHAGCAAAAALHRPGIARVGSSDRKPDGFDLRLGLASYTFREFDLEAALEMTKRLGLTRIAFKDFHLPLDSTAARIRRTAARVRAEGLDLYGCGVVYMKSRSEVDRAFAYAQAAGMEIVIGVPDYELIDYVDGRIREHGIAVAVHNHGPGDQLYPTPQSAYDRVKHLDPRFGLCVDVGHTQRSGVDPAAAVLAFADRVLDVHIKDVTAASSAGTTIEIGRGVIDIPEVCRALRSIRFSGTVSFEFEKDGKDPLPGTAESVGYVRGVLDAL
jgi:sugar phosphate isomerase/epimerase